MSDISNLPQKNNIKNRPDGRTKVSHFEIIEEIAKAPDDESVLIQVQALGVGAWIRTNLNKTAFHGATVTGLWAFMATQSITYL